MKDDVILGLALLALVIGSLGIGLATSYMRRNQFTDRNLMICGSLVLVDMVLLIIVALLKLT